MTLSVVNTMNIAHGNIMLGTKYKQQTNIAKIKWLLQQLVLWFCWQLFSVPRVHGGLDICSV